MLNVAFYLPRRSRELSVFGSAAYALQPTAGMRKRELLVSGLIACGTAALMIDVARPPDHGRARFSVATTEVRVIQSAALVYVSEHTGECPTMQDLKRSETLDKFEPTTDPWNTELLIVCEERGATVTSAGPDKQFDTEDDISVPAAHPAINATKTR